MNNPYSTNLPSYEDQNKSKFGNWLGNQDVSQGVSSGLAAGQAYSTPDDFSVDAYAGLKGSGQGLMSGGVIGAIVGGVTAQIGQFSKVNKAVENLDTSVQGVQYDAYGRPVYGGASVTTGQSNISALNKGEKSINKGIDPATRVFSGLFGTKKKLRRARRKIERNIRRAQDSYNKSAVDFTNQQNQMQEYQDRLDGRFINQYG